MWYLWYAGPGVSDSVVFPSGQAWKDLMTWMEFTSCQFSDFIAFPKIGLQRLVSTYQVFNSILGVLKNRPKAQLLLRE